jgi:hypothetical protein
MQKNDRTRNSSKSNLKKEGLKMVNFNMGTYHYRGVRYQIWTHELFGSPGYILAIAEIEKGKWNLRSVVKHFCKAAEKFLPYQKPVTDEEVTAIIETGKEFSADGGYMKTGALPYMG